MRSGGDRRSKGAAVQRCWAVGEAQGGSGRQHCPGRGCWVRWRQKPLGVTTLLSCHEGVWGLGGGGDEQGRTRTSDRAVLDTHRRFDAGCVLLALVGLAWIKEGEGRGGGVMGRRD